MTWPVVQKPSADKVLLNSFENLDLSKYRIRNCYVLSTLKYPIPIVGSSEPFSKSGLHFKHPASHIVSVLGGFKRFIMNFLNCET